MPSWVWVQDRTQVLSHQSLVCYCVCHSTSNYIIPVGYLALLEIFIVSSYPLFLCLSISLYLQQSLNNTTQLDNPTLLRIIIASTDPLFLCLLSTFLYLCLAPLSHCLSVSLSLCLSVSLSLCLSNCFCTSLYDFDK